MKQVAKRGTLAPVEQALRRLISRRGMSMSLRQHAVAARWAELVGHRIASHCWPLELRDGVLLVAVADSAWLQQLSFLRAELVVRIKTELPDCELESIRLVAAAQGQGMRPRARLGTARVPEAETFVVPPTERHRAESCAEAELPPLPDDEIRRRIVSARAAQLALQRARPETTQAPASASARPGARGGG
ncbi:MAG: DUF721 domain-containing protein [Proteobacteria bacterium]|nr:DUF721 domain-containing protein [Pseudomonadota bacterium]